MTREFKRAFINTNKLGSIEPYIRTDDLLIETSKLNTGNPKSMEPIMAQTRNRILTLYLLICITVACARSPSKIVNGDAASLGEFPHQVSIQINEVHHCGGSIIDATHILTAAHCLVNEKYEINGGMDVVTGTNYRLERTASNVFPVTKVLYYEGYETFYNENDIGIVKLARPIPFNNHQRPIKLSTRDPPDSTHGLVISGWGVTSWNGLLENPQFPRVLQKLDVRVVGNEECHNRWKQQTYYSSNILPTHICILPTAKVAGMCLGDSGGPLIYRNEIIGVASLGMPCAKGYPDIYTRVSRFLPWISWALTQ